MSSNLEYKNLTCLKHYMDVGDGTKIYKSCIYLLSTLLEGNRCVSISLT